MPDAARCLRRHSYTRPCQTILLPYARLSVQSALNQYSLPQGLKSLQSAVSAYYNKRYGLREGAANKEIGPENVLVSELRKAISACWSSSLELSSKV